MKTKFYKLFLLLIVIVFMLSFISCKDTDTEAKILELEEKIEEFEKEDKEIEGQATQEPETTEASEQECSTAETTSEAKKEFSPAIVYTLEIPGYTADVYVSEGYAYMGAGSGGMHIIKLFSE